MRIASVEARAGDWLNFEGVSAVSVLVAPDASPTMTDVQPLLAPEVAAGILGAAILARFPLHFSTRSAFAYGAKSEKKRKGRRR